MDTSGHAEILRNTMQQLTTQFANETDMNVILRGVTASAVELIQGVDCADVLLVSGDDPFQSLAATSQLAVQVDRLQQEFREGPCLDAAAGRSVTISNNLREDHRWPRFSKAAVAAGVNSLMSFELYTHNASTGALNLFGLAPDIFTPEAEAVGAMLATHAATALIANDRQLQFHSALATRDMIGQAKGMIMERFNIDAVRAFELLKRLSQDSNTRLADIAAEVVARGSDQKTTDGEGPSASSDQ